jgi:hypothetical protein
VTLRILLTPGETGPLVSLQDCVREVWETERKARDERIAKRREKGAGLDDGIVWALVSSTDVAAAIAAHDSGKLRASAQKLVDATADLIVPLDPYTPNPALDGISVRFCVMAETERRTLQGKVAGAWREVASLFAAQASEEKIIEAQERAFAAQGAFILASVDAVEGIGDTTGKPFDVGPELLEALRREGILGALFDAASAFQALPSGKALRFGLPLARTSASSIATHAQSTSTNSEGVTAVVSTSTGGPQ